MSESRGFPVRALLLATLATGFVGGSAVDALAQANGSTNQSGVETVTVTAERREENLQKVPVTMSVVTQSELDNENINTTTDLTKAVPSLTASDEGVLQIRGIGTEGYGRSAEQSASLVVDGVVLPQYNYTNALYDLSRVEVLSGPQGTLFGKNATAGVVSVVTNAPVLGEYQAIAHVDAGDYDYVHSYAIANIPLGDDAALRVSIHHDTTGHIVENTLYGKWDYNFDNGVRARLLWEPNSDLTINVSADYEKLGSNGVNGVADFAGVQVYTGAPQGSELQAILASCGIVAGKNNNKVCGNSLTSSTMPTSDTYGRLDGGGSLQIDYRIPDTGLLFTSITALRESQNESFGTGVGVCGEFCDSTPLNILDTNLVPYNQSVWSEEARIASPASDPINFVAGVYYSREIEHDNIDQAGQFGFPLGSLQYRRLIHIRVNEQNYAAFGQVNWNVTQDLKLFAGARVTHDDVSDYSYNLFPDAYPAGNYIYTGNTGFFSVLPINSCTLAGGVPYDAVQIPCPAGTSTGQQGTLRKTGLSGTAGVQYQIDPDVMVFGSVAEGYKGPYINEAETYIPNYPGLQPLAVKPEYPLDFELGVKSTLFDKVAVNASLFTDDVEHFQTTIYVPPGPNQAIANFVTGNAPHLISRGLDVSFYGNVADDLSINGGLIYDDAHFAKNFLVNCASGPCPAIDQMPFASKFRFNLAGEYHRPLFDNIDGFLQPSLAIETNYPYGSAPGSPESPPRYLVDGRAGIRSADGHWSLAIFCRNCLDKRYPILEEPDGYAAYDGAYVPAVPGGKLGSGVPAWQFLTIDSYRVVGLTLDLDY